jgi:predicted small lipoprotein YifL
MALVVAHFRRGKNPFYCDPERARLYCLALGFFNLFTGAVMRSLLLLLSLCGLLLACGQKGPLYLPQSDKPAPEQSAPDDEE